MDTITLGCHPSQHSSTRFIRIRIRSAIHWKAWDSIPSPGTQVSVVATSRLPRNAKAWEWNLSWANAVEPSKQSSVQISQRQIIRMSLHVYWPATAILTLFVVGVIMILLKYGPRFCKTRNTPLPTNADLQDRAYSHRVSLSVA